MGLRLCHVMSYLGMLQTFWIVDCDNPEWGIFIFPPALKRQPPGLQGNRFCYLSLTALPVDYKALGKEIKKNTPSLVLLNVPPPPLGVSSARVEAKTLETPVPGKWKKWFKSPLPRKAAPSSGIGSPAVWRSALPQGNSSAEPFQTPCGFIYTYFHDSFLYVTAASGWRRVTKCYRFSYGRQVRCHHTEQSQSRKLPTVCIAEVTFYPGCAIAVI